MSSKIIILGLLNESSKTGYEMKKYIDDVFSAFYTGSYGMVYPMLNKLTKEELINKEINYQEGKPNQNIYSITKKGQEYLKNKIRKTKIKEMEIKSHFNVLMYFIYLMNDDKHKIKIIEQEYQSLVKKFDKFKRINNTEMIKKMNKEQKLIFDLGRETMEVKIKILAKYLKEHGG